MCTYRYVGWLISQYCMCMEYIWICWLVDITVCVWRMYNSVHLPSNHSAFLCIRSNHSLCVELTGLLPGQKPGKPYITVGSLFSETVAVDDAVIGGDLVLGLLGVENLQKVPVRRFGATRGSLWCDLFSRHCEAGTKLSKGRACPNSTLFLGG